MQKKMLIIPSILICFLLNSKISAAEAQPKSLAPTQKVISLSQTPKGFKIISSSLQFSADLRHVTYVAYSDNTHNVVCLDNKTSPPYYAVQPKTPLFSPAKNRLAYIAYKTKDDAIVVVDGQPSEIVDNADNFQFSKDGSRYACRAQKGKDFFIMVDGMPGTTYIGIPVKDNMMFSPDSKHFVYAALTDNGIIFVVDGKEEKLFFSFIEGVKFSYDSNHYAYKARTEKKADKEKWCVVKDGTTGPVYDKIFDLIFSYDSKHLAYIAIKDRQMVLVIDGNEMETHEFIGLAVFSLDSSRLLAYPFIDDKKWYMVLNGKKSSSYDAISKFYQSIDNSRYAYFAKDNNKWFCIVDGTKGTGFETGVDAFVYSNDCKRYAYAGIEKEMGRIVIDGAQSAPYKTVGEPYFSEDSKHVVYRARKEAGGNWYTVLNGKESAMSYPAIGRYNFSPDSKHLAFSALLNINQSVMVVDGEEQCKDQNFKILGDLYFSPDGNHIAYFVRAGENTWHFVVNGQVLPESYGGFMKGTPLIFDSPNHFHTIGLNNTKTGEEFALIECDIPESFKLKSILQ